MSSSFIIIGITDASEPCLDKSVRACIQGHKVFSGGKRHHEIVASLLPRDAKWIDIKAPLNEVFAQYAAIDEQIVVFASGDPLFFGFANTVKRKLPDAEIELYPAFNSLQMLAHRLVMPYHDMRIVSLTGRPWDEFYGSLIEHEPKIGVLTDGEHNPVTIAQRMIDYGYDDYEMIVGEHIGSESKERVTRWQLNELHEGMTFDYPNCLILKAKHKPTPRFFGIPDTAFDILDGRPRMITKMPIRLLSLQAMSLPQKNVMWDVGFCTGSVSIEARLMFPHLHIVAFEKREEGEQLMRNNARRMHAPGIATIIGDFMECDISRLPKPDAVFIGGHGGHLKEIMSKVNDVLEPGGCIVMNSVTAMSKAMFEDSASQLGMDMGAPLHLSIDDYNPIYIMKCTKRMNDK